MAAARVRVIPTPRWPELGQDRVKCYPLCSESVKKSLWSKVQGFQGFTNPAMVGVRYHASPALFFSIGVSFDNNHALLIRPGLTYRFGAR